MLVAGLQVASTHPVACSYEERSRVVNEGIHAMSSTISTVTRNTHQSIFADTTP
jgi:hypothetical protein